MSEVDQSKEVLQKEIVNNSFQFLHGLVDLNDSLSLAAEEDPDTCKTDRELFTYFDQAICSFCDSTDLNHIFTKPRSIRNQDRRLPGEHGGVYLRFATDDGTELRVNVFGGLRTSESSDYKDSDKTCQNTHTKRTDRLSEKSTSINIQLNFDEGTKLESWIQYNPNNGGSFLQTALKIDNEEVKCNPVISPKSYRFQEIKEGIFQPVRKLVKYIPSA